jgi:hypothetical protein
MPRQVSDEEYNFLQGRRQVADFVESIYNDPNLNKDAKALIKKKYPNLQIPDYDLESKIEGRFAAEKKARDDADAATKQKKQDADIAASRKQVMEEYGLNEDGMKKLEDMMVEKNIGDYEAAAVYFASKNPRTSEPDYDSGFWNHGKEFRKEGFKEIAADPEGWARKEIMKAIHADERVAKGQR